MEISFPYKVLIFYAQYNSLKLSAFLEPTLERCGVLNTLFLFYNFSAIQEPVTTESGDSDNWAPESGCDQDDEDCHDTDDDGSGDSGGGYWDRMTTSGSRTSKCGPIRGQYSGHVTCIDQ